MGDVEQKADAAARGNAPGAEELFARYGQRLVRLAEQFLSSRLAGRIEGEDVVQSVFRTFFRRSQAGEFPIDNSGQIWRLLVRITLRKAQAKGRWHTAEKRNPAAECPGGEALLAEALAREPGPEEAVVLVDEIEALLHGLPPLFGQILGLRLQGHSVADIGPELGISRQTVYRALELLQERLLRENP